MPPRGRRAGRVAEFHVAQSVEWEEHKIESHQQSNAQKNFDETSLEDVVRVQKGEILVYGEIEDRGKTRHQAVGEVRGRVQDLE